MKTRTAALVNEVKKRLEKVNVDTDVVLLIFLNRYEEIDYVSTVDDNSDDLHEELSVRAGNPNWEICSVKSATNEVFIRGKWQATADVTDELLFDAVDEAIAERIRFYSERQEIHGSCAWPKSQATY